MKDYSELDYSALTAECADDETDGYPPPLGIVGALIWLVILGSGGVISITLIGAAVAWVRGLL